MYAENISAISRDDDTKIETAIQTAITQASGYLSRFDIAAIFATEGDERNKFSDLTMYIKDIAKWHFIKIANVSVDMELAQSCYKDAIAELGKIQGGRIVPFGWPTNSTEDYSGSVIVKSNTKRGNYY